MTSSMVRFRVGTEHFVFPRLFDYRPSLRVTFENFVPVDREIVSFVRISETDATVGERLRESREVAELERIGHDGANSLYEIEWADEEDLPELFRALIDNDVTVFSVRAADGDWHFEVRFSSTEEMSEFQNRCLQSGIPLQVEELHEFGQDGSPGRILTKRQQDILKLATEKGYYKVPQDTTLEKLASELGIEVSSASECLRRAEDRVMQRYWKRGRSGQ